MIKRNIIFNEELHTYTDEDGNPYTSVTTLIGKYTPVFDKGFWSKYKSRETGIPQKQILENWQDITNEANRKGTTEHKLLEDSINEAKGYKKEVLLVTALNRLTGVEFTNINIDILAQSELAKKYPDIFKYLLSKINIGFKLYVEKRTYSYEHLVAGTIDCLLVKGKDFIIVDWKTNKKELHFKSGYYKKVGGIESTTWIDTDDRMLSPINGLQHCKGNIYTLQLSMYAYILELWGLSCIGLVLYHIREGLVPKAYNILYDKMSAEILLNEAKTASSISKTSNKTNLFGIT